MKLNLNIVNKIDKEKVAFFRFKKIKNKYLLTNDVGEFIFLNEKDFIGYVSGRLGLKSKKMSELKQKGFIRNQMDFSRIVELYKSKHAVIPQGPGLHIVVVTLRCNHKCLYCHASAVSDDKTSYDMSQDTARKAVDLIFESPSNYIAIEFQGGEPLLNWPVVKFIIEYARTKNKKIKKELDIRLISNFSLMDDIKLSFLLNNRVGLCSSLDGPEYVHNKNRIYLDGSSHKEVTYWLKKAGKLYKKDFPSSIPAAVTTVTRMSLPHHKEIVDEYVNLGLNNIYLRPLNPFGFAKKTWAGIGYSADEYIKFYLKALDYIIKLNLRGKDIKEVLAGTFLVKILTVTDPNHYDFRSPCGAVIGQIAYDHNGDIYTCDEGRMIARTGDESFRVGTVKSKYKDLISSPVAKSMCVASCTDTLAGCTDCVYKPYCGVCPVYNYSVDGNIFSQMTTNERCKILKAIFDYLFIKMEDEKVLKIFENWLGYFRDRARTSGDVFC